MRVILLKNIYQVGAFSSGLVIGCGNLVSTIYLCRIEAMNNEVQFPIDEVLTTGTFGIFRSVVKSVAYGAIWPIFWPYTVSKALFKNPLMLTRHDHMDGKPVKTPFFPSTINKHGMWPHFIPLSLDRLRIKYSSLPYRKYICKYDTYE